MRAAWIAGAFVAAIALPAAPPVAALPLPDDRKVPKGAALAVVADRPEVLLGENVVLRLILRNDGGPPFSICPMTWDRSASRDVLVTLSLKDEKGVEAWDPFPDNSGSGGPVPPDVTLGKGESWEEKLELWRWRVPDRAGTWTVRVSRHFGWDGTPERPNPSAVTTLRFRAPTEAEAKKVVDGMLAEGKRPRLHSACYPIYVPILEERAAAGEAAAVHGLSLNRDVAATRALLRLFASKRRDVAAAAGRWVAGRIQVPPDGGWKSDNAPPWSSPFAPADIAPSWRAEFAAEALAAARAFILASGDPPVGPAGDVLRLLGTPEDGKTVVAGLDRIARFFEERTGGGIEPGPGLHPESELESIARAAGALLRRGLAAPACPSNAGEALLWLMQLRMSDREKPRDWRKSLEDLAAHPLKLVRADVARCCREPAQDAPDLCRALRERLRKDPDEMVRKAAGE